MNDSKLLSNRELAARWNVSLDDIVNNKFFNPGKMPPHFFVDGLVRYDITVIEDFEKTNSLDKLFI